nr:hypothetical protein GCM10020093_111250 [Planobispora longispora]
MEALVHRRGAWTRRTAGGPGFVGQFSVSPDGRRIAWIDARSRLRVTGPSGDRVIARDARYIGPCATPAWSPDGRRVAYPLDAEAGTPVVMVVGADGRGRARLGRTRGVCHLAWSGDGRVLAGYAGTTDGVCLLDTVTGKSRRVPGVDLANHVESLSEDGRRIVVRTIRRSEPAGDGSWPAWFTPSIYDTRTGRKIAVPVGGRLIGARYLPGDRLAVRVAGRTHNTLVIVSSGGTRERVAEPARVRKHALVRVLR